MAASDGESMGDLPQNQASAAAKLADALVSECGATEAGATEAMRRARLELRRARRARSRKGFALWASVIEAIGLRRGATPAAGRDGLNGGRLPSQAPESTREHKTSKVKS